MSSILLITLGAAKPSTRLRMRPLAEALRRRGHSVALEYLPRSPLGRVRLLKAAALHDIVVLQKKLFPVFFVTLLHRINPRLVFDVDDAVMFHEQERGQPINGKYFRRFAVTAAASRVVVAGNAYVADFARAAQARDPKRRTVVLPTPVDIHALAAKTDYGDASSGHVTAGWIGTKGNLGQLAQLAPSLREVQDEIPGFRLRVVADGHPDLPGVQVEAKPWRAQDEQADLHGFDIGIMPLGDSLWNRGKGGFKLLQYMTAGLPAIASPVGINADIIAHGENGFLADTGEAWRSSLLLLARRPELRQRIGQAARRTVENAYSLDLYLDRYVEVVESCAS